MEPTPVETGDTFVSQDLAQTVDIVGVVGGLHGSVPGLQSLVHDPGLDQVQRVAGQGAEHSGK